MLVDEAIHSFWEKKYGAANRIKRFGIQDESGEKVVEIYLKKVNLLPLPNKKLFKLYKGDAVEATPVFVSRTSTITELETKVKRLLMGYLYMVLKNKSYVVSKCRLW